MDSVGEGVSQETPGYSMTIVTYVVNGRVRGHGGGDERGDPTVRTVCIGCCHAFLNSATYVGLAVVSFIFVQ